MPLTVLAPCAGTVLALNDVPDAVFSAGMVGPGAAVDPARPGPAGVVAPVAGAIAALHPHAFVVEVAPGRAVLVHLGLDTVQLRGAGFTVHRSVGDRVEAGERVLTWDPGAVADGGRSPVCPVVALQGAPGAVVTVPAPGAVVAAGEALLTWADADDDA